MFIFVSSNIQATINLPNDQELADTVAWIKAPLLSATQGCQTPSTQQSPIAFPDPAQPSGLFCSVPEYGTGQFQGTWLYPWTHLTGFWESTESMPHRLPPDHA